MRLFLVAAFVLLASPSWASDTWGKSCAHTGANSVSAPADPTSVIGAGPHASGLPRVACLGWGETSTTSKVLTVRASTVLFTLIDDVAGTSATATAMIQKCVCDIENIAQNGNTCIDILDTNLTGTEGAPGTQNASVRAGPGCYRAVTVAGATGDFPLLTAEAEE